MTLSKKKHTWALKLFISLFILAKLFTLLHWSYVNILSLSSAIVLILFYPFRYFYKQNKVLLDHVKMILVLTYCINIIFQLQDFKPLDVLQTLLFFYWFVNEGFFYFDFNFSFKKGKEREQNILDSFEENHSKNNFYVIIDYLLVVSIILILLISLFRIMHWPFQSEMMILGYGLLAIVIWFKKF